MPQINNQMQNCFLSSIHTIPQSALLMEIANNMYRDVSVSHGNW